LPPGLEVEHEALTAPPLRDEPLHDVSKMERRERFATDAPFERDGKMTRLKQNADKFENGLQH